MTGLAPTRKVSTAGVSGAATAVVLWIVDSAGVEVPAGIAAAIATIVAAALAYAVPPAGPDLPPSR